jgi:tRNA(adenine34) deaminase
MNMGEDSLFMRQALVEAQKAYHIKEVPVGAVVVLGDKIIARAHNSVESLLDPTAHAELICLRKAAAAIGNWRLLNATLYTTLEPCSMCAGALFLARVLRVVFGAYDLRHGAAGSFVDLFAKPHPIHRLIIKGGVLADESSKLLKDFFRKRRTGKF